MPRAVREVDPTSLGSGARLREFIRLGTKDYIWFLFIRGMFRHWHVTLSVISVFTVWYGFGIANLWNFVWAVCLIVGLWITGMCSAGIYYGADWRTPLYWMRLKRGWHHCMMGVELKSRDKRHVPRLYRIRPIRDGIRANVNMAIAARVVNDLRAEMADICEILGFRQVQVFPLKRPGHARLVLLATDERTIPESSVSEASSIDEFGGRTVDVTDGFPKVVFGKTASGLAELSLVVSILVVGLSNSGKTNLLKAIFHGLLRQGIPHELYIIDDKGGVSFAELENYPNTLAYCETAKAAERVLEQAVADMWARSKQFRHRKKNNSDPIYPSAAFPLRIIFIDELLLLQKSIKEGIEGNLGVLLTVGREFLYVVIALSQGSQVDLLGRIRDLFPQRIALATPNAETTDACLGKDAEKNGAKCSEIARNTPGVGYYRQEDGRGYTRFRASEVVGTLLTNVEGYDKPSRQGVDYNRRCAVYRYYNLAGRALYFGKTFDPERRAKEEAADKMWWPHIDHTRTKIDWYANEEDALKMEKYFIQQEDPIENKKLRNLSKVLR